MRQNLRRRKPNFLCLSLFVSAVCVLVQWMTPHNQFGQIGNVARMLLHPETSLPLHILDARAPFGSKIKTKHISEALL